MEFFEVIEKRASYREAFKEVAIPEEDIRDILMAGIKAPSGYNMQTTTFVVVEDKEMLSKMAEIWPTKAMKTAPVILAAVSEEKTNDAPGAAHFSFATEDYAAAVESIMLAIVAKGYAGVWMDGMTRMDEAKYKQLTELLNVPANMKLRTIIPFGVPEKEVKMKDKKSFEERVVRNHF